MAALDDRHGGKVAYTSVAAAMPEGGHGRGTSSERRDPEPRVPIIGLDSGCIPGTKPQPGCSGAYLDRCGRDIVRGRLKRTRRRDHRG